jgi:hypothetical protein
VVCFIILWQISDMLHCYHTSDNELVGFFLGTKRGRWWEEVVRKESHGFPMGSPEAMLVRKV